MGALLLAAAVTAGYALGRLRPGTRAFAWASDTIDRTDITRRTVRWWLCQVVFAAVILARLAIAPRETARDWHTWRRRRTAPPVRASVAVLDVEGPDAR
ncbi:hypothetical protein ACH4LK_22575 [Streptomyces lydicus]|uniref:hypothetical protein n=1 Tax=Streptomyces lydicus TaxID=47763 RepID=UPI0037891C9B